MKCPMLDAYYKECEVENGALLDRIKELEKTLYSLGQSCVMGSREDVILALHKAREVLGTDYEIN